MAAIKKPRPYVLILCHPLTGHITPLLGVVGALLERGWTDVGFLGPTAHRARIEAAGAEFFQLLGRADLDDRSLFGKAPPVPDYHELPWSERVLIDTRVQCFDTIPDQWASIRDALASLRAREGARRQVVVVCEAFVFGILPMKYGAPLPEGVPEPRTICISVTPAMIRTRGQPPFGFALSYDPSPAGVGRAAEMWARWLGMAAPLTAHLDAKILEAGGRHGTGVPFLTGANYTCHEAILQIGLPSFEYPRDDWPAGFKFVGIIPPKIAASTAESAQIPWWDEFVANAGMPRDDPGRKKIIVVTQGTVEIDARELIIPTMEAVSGMDDVVLVAILGVRGGVLPVATRVPGNVRVVDYLRYGAVLPHTDIWVHNAGYGAVTQGIAAGIPMVVAGEGQDKPENARRVGWSGIGVDLKTALPTAEQVKEAILDVITNNTYREKVRAMQKEMEEWDFGGLVEKEVLKLVG